MKRLSLLILIFISTFALNAADSLKTVSFAYDVDFLMNFDNRELYRSAYSSSMTIFGARVTPSVGISVRPQAGEEHNVMIGADLMKDFGHGGSKILEEIVMYYRMQKDLGDTDLTLYAGIYPRSRTTWDYSPAFFSDSLLFYDNNLEGIMMQVKRPKASFEVACDWMGQYGDASRERFMILTSGEGMVVPFMSLGWSAYMYHFANSWQSKGVVDNILINPYVKFDIGEQVGMQRLSFRIGWLQTMQHDRVNVGHYIFPGGGEFEFEARNWNVGILNRLFAGRNLMPYYNCLDNAGVKYGSSLYMGDPFYRVYDDGRTSHGIYDRMEFYYEPKIKGTAQWLKIRIAAMFHFNSLRYCGAQQVVRVSFNLQELLAR